MNRATFTATALAVLAVSACADDGGPPLQTGSGSTGTPGTTTTPATTVDPTTAGSGSGGSSSTGEDVEPGPWHPSDVLPSLDDEVRGHRDVRGLIHAHSPYSFRSLRGSRQR